MRPQNSRDRGRVRACGRRAGRSWRAPRL